MSLRLLALAAAMTVGASAASAQTTYNCAEPANRTLQLCIDACAMPENASRQACVDLRAANSSGASDLGLPDVGAGTTVTNLVPFIVPAVIGVAAIAAINSSTSTTSTTSP